MNGSKPWEQEQHVQGTHRSRGRGASQRGQRISDLIISSGFINLDFADVKKVMEQMGTAIMGTGKAKGENRATEAAKQAINSPLLEDISVHGARGLLMNITGPSDMTMEEIDEASNFIKGEVDSEAEIFWVWSSMKTWVMRS